MKVQKTSIILTVFLTFCLISVSTAMASLPIIGPEVTRQAKNFVMDDGVEISGTVHYPTTLIEKSCPPIIFAASWSTPKQEYETMCYRFAKEGYITYSYEMRGWFGSNNHGAEIDMCGPRSMEDLGIIMDSLENQGRFGNAVLDQSTGFTLIGISQGGLHSLTGAFTHPERINNIIVMSAPADIYEALNGNNTPRSASMRGLVSSGEKHSLEAEIPEIRDYVLKHENLDFARAYANKRSASYEDNLAVFNNWDIPIYIMHNYNDAYFGPNQALNFFEKLTVPNKRLDFHPGIHASYEAMGMIGFYPECWDNAVDWVNYHAKGENNNILSTKVSFKNTATGSTEKFDHWPTNEIKTKTFYLSSNKRSKTVYKKKWFQKTIFGSIFKWFKWIPETINYTVDRTMETSQANAVAGSKSMTNGDGGFDVATPVADLLAEGIGGIEDFTGIDVPSLPIGQVEEVFYAQTMIDQTGLTAGLNYNHCALFKSAILLNPIKLTGTPRVVIWVKPQSEEIRMVAHLVAIGPLGAMFTLKTHMPFTKYNCTVGHPTKIAFDLETQASKIPAGHRVGLLIDTYDPQFDNPYFPSSFGFEILYSDTYPSKLIVPYVE